VSILRRATLLALLVLGLTVGPASGGFTPPAVKGTPQFVISGHGWGHGVGMSQWGAYGYAQKGVTYDKIVTHYFPGTELETTTVKSIRVLLVKTPSVTISSTGPWKVKDGSTAAVTMPAGKLTLNPELTFKLPGTTELETFAGPLTFTSATPLVFKKAYRGTFTVTSDGKDLTLVNTVPLEQYLYAVVPSEMPKTWPAEALNAQSVAARSYALAQRRTSGPFDVYPDTRSQVYGGVTAEAPTATAAVDATAGEVLTYGGKIATTYFFSSSGGRTAASADIWKGAPIPYLVSVSDPYDTASPYHNWGPLTFTADKLAKALKVSGRLLDVQTTVNNSKRVDTLSAIGAGGELDVAGNDVRTMLGLRSTFFTVGVLSLDPLPSTKLAYGAPFTLTGLGRGLDDLELEQRTAGTDAWVPNRAIAADADGSYSLTVKAVGPAEYRVTTESLSTPSTNVVVAPVLTLKASRDLTKLKGVVRPVVPGASVQIQQLGRRWTTVAKVLPSRTGRFGFAPSAPGGVYRARVVPGNGWAVGLSPKVALQ
jgi:stage II sporulation protein D